jgi:hypothetical protein
MHALPDAALNFSGASVFSRRSLGQYPAVRRYYIRTASPLHKYSRAHRPTAYRGGSRTPNLFLGTWGNWVSS